MTATAGGVAVLRTCEPWMSLFHMALACRVTRNAVMKAVIAHTVVLTTHPHPNSSPEREGRVGKLVSKKWTLSTWHTFMAGKRLV